MSRQVIDIDDDRRVVFGWDPSFATWYAQLWDRQFDDDFEWGRPLAVVGYHPSEKVPPFSGHYGPFPVDSPAELRDYVRGQWDVDLPLVEEWLIR